MPSRALLRPHFFHLTRSELPCLKFAKGTRNSARAIPRGIVNGQLAALLPEGAVKATATDVLQNGRSRSLHNSVRRASFQWVDLKKDGKGGISSNYFEEKEYYEEPYMDDAKILQSLMDQMGFKQEQDKDEKKPRKGPAPLQGSTQSMRNVNDQHEPNSQSHPHPVKQDEANKKQSNSSDKYPFRNELDADVIEDCRLLDIEGRQRHRDNQPTFGNEIYISPKDDSSFLDAKRPGIQGRHTPMYRRVHVNTGVDDRHIFNTREQSNEDSAIRYQNKLHVHAGKDRHRKSVHPLEAREYIADEAATNLVDEVDHEALQQEDREKIRFLTPDNTKSESGKIRRATEIPSPNIKLLPIPPFLRQLNPSKQFHEKAFSASWDPGTLKSLQQKLKESPFSTAFNLNPFARALATPIRQCAYTNTRLPSSCLLDFHLLHDPASKTRSLMPLKLMAMMIPKWNDATAEPGMDRGLSKEQLQDAQSGKPKGSSNFYLNRFNVLEGQSRSRKKGLVFSRKLHQELKPGEKPEWRSDMPDFVLAALRRIVLKQLRRFFKRKVVADRPGPFVTPPGGMGLERLDEVDNVMCVMKLRTPPDHESHIHHSYADTSSDTASGDISNLEQPFGLETDTRVETNSSEILQQAVDAPSESYEIKTAVVETSHSSNVEVDNQSIGSHRQEELQDVSEVGGNDDATGQHDELHIESDESPKEIRVHKSENQEQTKRFTWRRSQGPWSEEEDNSFLGNLGPLPPPFEPALLYFPTAHYRNRRVPIYHLPDLLGEDMYNTLVEGTVFADKSYVAMTLGPGTFHPQMWLLKLRSYLAKEKSATSKY